MNAATDTTPQDDPRTRRRRLAETAEQEAREALEEAREALEALGKVPATHPHQAAARTKEALEALLPGFVAHQALLLHAGELRNDFTRRASLAMADHLHRDLQTAWARAIGEVAGTETEVAGG